MMWNDAFRGKIVLITGAARGMGRAFSIAFARAGAKVIMIDICKGDPAVPYKPATVEDLKETSRLVSEFSSDYLALVADVSNVDEVNESTAKALKRFNNVDILVNAAGILPGWHQVKDLEPWMWDRTIDVILNGAFYMIKAVLPGMISKKWGRIINISSTGGLIGFPGSAPYTAAKHGLLGLTKSLALEVASYNITANAVCPGRTNTVMNTEMISTSREYNETGDSMEVFPGRGMMEPDDISGLILFLASDMARDITGTCISIDRGYTAK